MIGKVRRRLHHAPRIARGADAPAFAGEGDEVVVTTIVTPGSGKAMLEDAALQIFAKGLADIGLGGVDFAPQKVRVRNGEKASLHINQSMPMQWVQKIESQSATLSAAGTSASSNSGGVTQAVTWMESGQSLTVTPHWSGGKQAVKIEIEVQSSAVDERTSSDLPATQRQRYSSTISAPLNRWVTIASSCKPAQAGSFSSAGSNEGRRLTQIRVSREP